MYYIIYKITNQIDGKFYIGSHKTKNLNDDYMGSGKYLKYAQNKYGIEKFVKEILFIFDNEKEMYSKESEIVNEDFLCSENTYNLKIGGFGGWDHLKGDKSNNVKNHRKTGNCGWKRQDYKQTEHYKKSISEGVKKLYKNGYVNPFKGKKHSNETKSLISKKNSLNQSGEKNSQYGTMWITNGEINLKIKKNMSIPEGYIKGRKIIKK